MLVGKVTLVPDICKRKTVFVLGHVWEAKVERKTPYHSIRGTNWKVSLDGSGQLEAPNNSLENPEQTPSMIPTINLQNGRLSAPWGFSEILKNWIGFKGLGPGISEG